MSEIKRYWKKKLVDQNITVEYSSEEDEITIVIKEMLGNKVLLGLKSLTIDPSYVEPLYKLLKDVVKEQ